MYRLLIIVAVFFNCTFPVLAEEAYNAGFVEGIWYSAPVYSGQPIRIHTAVRNTTAGELTGTVRFTDNGQQIGTTYVKALPGTIEEAWVDWTPSFGDHKVSATLTDVKLEEAGKAPQSIAIESTLAEDALFVDLDTDRDGIGNTEDTDDDNDGISDTTEVTNGTDPLIVNEPERAEEETDRDTESSRNRNRSNSDNNSESNKSTDVPTTPVPSREGLERFFNDSGRVDAALSKVTDSVSETKQKLDTYRAERNSDETEVADNTDKTGTETGTSTGETATITTTRITPEKPGVVAYVLGGFKSIFGALYTFLLFLLSGLLAHPALVEFILLILILYIIVKVARRLAARPKEFSE